MTIVKRKLKIPIVLSGLESSRVLDFVMEHQKQPDWCWAANGSSVGNFYHGAGAFTQCGIVNTCLNRATCCDDPASCNQYGYLDQALIAAESFDSATGGSAGYAVISKQIDDGHPVGTRIAWNGGGAHFTMLAGYDDNGSKLVVQDPWYGKSTVLFASYPTAYHGGGSWTHTYYTRQQ